MQSKIKKGKSVFLCWIYNCLERDLPNHDQGTDQVVLEETQRDQYYIFLWAASGLEVTVRESGGRDQWLC